MTKHVRVLAVSSPQDDGVPYLFDVAVGDDDKLKGRDFTFGLHGKFTGPRVYPFYMDAKGNIDFGTYGETDRMRSTNLHHKLIRVGELFTIKDGHRETSYKIARIDLLHF
jgi:hypothetical protein